MLVEVTAGLMRLSNLEGIKVYLLKCQKLHSDAHFFPVSSNSDVRSHFQRVQEFVQNFRIYA